MGETSEDTLQLDEIRRREVFGEKSKMRSTCDDWMDARLEWITGPRLFLIILGGIGVPSFLIGLVIGWTLK